jgi:hypothetical protein
LKPPITPQKSAVERKPQLIREAVKTSTSIAGSEQHISTSKLGIVPKSSMTILVGAPNSLKSVPQVWTDTEGSMAAETVRKRWPQTVKNMAEDVKQSAVELDIAAKREEGLEIAGALERLRAEIQQNERLK